MNAEHELTESWKHIPTLQQQVALQGETLEKQADWLNLQIDKLVDQSHSGWEKESRIEALSKLSLLSEMYAIIDFDKMIEVREKFQRLFPGHFSEYLNHLQSLSWQIAWPGCLDCRYFDKKCSLGLAPAKLWGDKRSFDQQCKSKERRLKAA